MTSTPIIATLDLPATDALPRALYLNLGLLSGNLMVMACVSHKVVSSAYSSTHELDEHAVAGPCLRLGTARFTLLPEEVEPVRAFLTRSPCAEKTIGPNSAKQAAPVTPPDGSCRELPPPDAVCSGGVKVQEALRGV